MTIRWIFLDFNSYFASVEQAENPQLRNKPIAVVPMMAETTCCLAASYPAKKWGVKTGTSVRDARKMCPGIVFIQAEHRKYTAYHNRIVRTVERQFPISKVFSIDEMAFELVGREQSEEFACRIAGKIKNAIYTEVNPALTCSIGIAPNRYLAKIASDMEKPDGQTIIRLEEIPNKLLTLQLRDFPGIGPNMEKRFLERRIITTRDMYELSIEKMREIWGGVEGERFWRLIRGENLPEKNTKRSAISHSKVLPPDKRTLGSAWAVTVRLLSKAAMRLREEGYYTQRLWLSVKFIGREKNDRHWHGYIKVSETKDSIVLIEELEKLWREIPEGRILRVGVALTHLVPETKHQLSLFEDPKRESLMRALDGVNKKYRQNVLYFASSQVAKDIGAAFIAFQRIPEEYE